MAITLDLGLRGKYMANTYFSMQKRANVIQSVKTFLKEYWPDILSTIVGAGAGGAAGYYLAPEKHKYLGAGIGAAVGGGLGLATPWAARRLFGGKEKEYRSPEKYVRDYGKLPGGAKAVIQMSTAEQAQTLDLIRSKDPFLYDKIIEAANRGEGSLQDIFIQFQDEIQRALLTP